MPRKIQDGKRACRYCKERKLPIQFHLTSLYTCLECLGDLSINEFRKKYRRNKGLGNIRKSGNSAGYIYIMYSTKKNLYKVGVAKNPFIRVKSLSRDEYNIEDLKLLCFGDPIGYAFDCENYIHSIISKFRVAFKKPCGGMAKELFSCTLSTVSDAFLKVCKSIYWLDKNTRSLVNLYIPKIDIDEVNKIRLERRYVTPNELLRRDKVVAGKIFKENLKYINRSIDKPWKLFLSYNYQIVKCYATGERIDHRFESVYDKKNKCISLGIYESYEKAKLVNKEFLEFLERERKYKQRYLRRRRVK